MKTKVKICGLTTLADIAGVNQYKPDYIGFVFAPSRRQVTKAQAAALKAALSPEIAAVGVFVNADIAEIQALAEAGIIDMAQLHGDEDAAYIHSLREQVCIPIIKAVRVGDTLPEGLADMAADYLLLDKLSDKAYGGLGESFDWHVLYGLQRPYFLAGGVHIGNLAAALALHPYCIDCSSGVETDGIKDAAKIAAFIGLVRGTELKA